MKKVITILFAIVFLAGGMATPAGAALQAVGPVTTVVPGGVPAFAPLPDWYQDKQGLQLGVCLDPAFCLPIGTGAAAEAFYWTADATLPAPLNGILIQAMEATPSLNVAFTRIRIRFDAPAAGDYTVTHPFGKITLAGLAPGVRAGNVTQDIGIITGNFAAALADEPLQAGTVNADGRSIGPFLIPADAPFVRDPVSGNVYISRPGVLHKVTGSPLGTNFFRIEGPGLPPGGVTTDLFDVTGRVANCVAPAVNAAPVAAAELFPVAASQPLAVNVIANDRDDVDIAVPPIGGGFGINRASIAITVPPTLGTAVATPDGTVTYTANPNASGLDTFTYTVQDYCMVPSNPVVENVIVERLAAAKAEFRPRTGKWTITGQSSLSTIPTVVPALPGAGGPNTVTLRKGSAAGPVIGTVPVQNGTWKFIGKSKTLPGAQPQDVHVESSATVKIIKPLKVQ